MGSNLGAFSFVFASSLAGLLWRELLRQKGVIVSATEFAKYNALPVVLLTTISCAVVLGEVYWFG